MTDGGKVFVTLHADKDALKNATASMRSSWPAAAAQKALKRITMFHQSLEAQNPVFFLGGPHPPHPPPKG